MSRIVGNQNIPIPAPQKSCDARFASDPQKMLCRELRIGFHMDEGARAHVFTVNASSVIQAQNEMEFNRTAKKQTSKKGDKKKHLFTMNTGFVIPAQDE